MWKHVSPGSGRENSKRRALSAAEPQPKTNWPRKITKITKNEEFFDIATYAFLRCLHALFTYYHDKLKRLKIGKESRSEMLTRELPDRANTCGEVLEKLEGKEFPPMDPKLLKAVRSGRGRRSNRPSRHAR